MNELVDVYIDGEKHKAFIISVFDIEDRTFCIYSIPNGDGSFGVKCGKKIEEQVVDIEDEKERKVVENITKTILLGQKKEALLNMDNEDAKFTITDENGEKKQAYIIGEFEIENKDYIAYAVDENEDTSGIYVKRIIYNDAGEEESLETITDPEERELVFNSLRAYISQEVGEL